MCCFLLLRLTYKNIAGNKFAPFSGTICTMAVQTKNNSFTSCLPLFSFKKTWQTFILAIHSWWLKELLTEGTDGKPILLRRGMNVGSTFRTTWSFQISSWVKVIHKRSIVKCWPVGRKFASNWLWAFSFHLINLWHLKTERTDWGAKEKK